MLHMIYPGTAESGKAGARGRVTHTYTYIYSEGLLMLSFS